MPRACGLQLLSIVPEIPVSELRLLRTPTTVRSYQDTKAAGNTSVTAYSYYVKAINAEKVSPASNTSEVPFRPIKLSATKAAQGVNLNWLDMSSNETGFQIYRKSGTCAGAGAFALITTTAGNVQKFSDKGAVGRVAYQVRATTKSAAQPFAYGFSGKSNCVEINPDCLLGIEV